MKNCPETIKSISKVLYKMFFICAVICVVLGFILRIINVNKATFAEFIDMFIGSSLSTTAMNVGERDGVLYIAAYAIKLALYQFILSFIFVLIYGYGELLENVKRITGKERKSVSGITYPERNDTSANAPVVQAPVIKNTIIKTTGTSLLLSRINKKKM